MADNKIAPAVGMRVRQEADDIYTAGDIRHSGSADGLIVNVNDLGQFRVRGADGNEQTFSRRCWGTVIVPADPTPEPPAAKWSQLDRVVAHGTVRAINHPGGIAVEFDGEGGLRSFLPDEAKYLRPEAAPAAPGAARVTFHEWPNGAIGRKGVCAQCGEATVWNNVRDCTDGPGRAYARYFQCGCGVVHIGALAAANDAVGQADTRGLQMQLADAKEALDGAEACMTYKDQQLGVLTREVTRLTKELKAARDQLRRRGGL